QTDARATAPRAKDQIQLATQPSALPQAPLRSPHIQKAEPAPLQQPKPPAAQPQAAQGRSCAGSRAAQQHPQAQLPAPPHPARREAEPPAGSCSGRPRPPAAPKTTADAAHTTTAPRQDAQPHATPLALLPPPPTAQPAPLPSALRTGCGSIPQHQGSNEGGWSGASPTANAHQAQKSRRQTQHAPITRPRQTRRAATPPAGCAPNALHKHEPRAQAAPRGPTSRSPSAEDDPIPQAMTAPCSPVAALQHAH